MKQESTFYKRTNSSDHDIEEKQELEANKAKYNTQKDISEEHECFHEKAERVSLPNNNARIQIIYDQQRKENKTENKTEKTLQE